MLAICFAFCWQSWCEKQHSLIKECQDTRFFQSAFQSEVLFFADLAVSCKKSIILMAKWSSFMKNFSVTWFLAHFNRTWTNLLGPGCHHSVQNFPNKDLCVLWPEWICSVQVVWGLICKMCGTLYTCPAPLLQVHTVNPVHTSYVLLAAYAWEILEHALHVWDSAEGHLQFTGYVCGSLVPVHCSCTRLIALMELVTSWPVLLHGGVVQNTGSLVRHLSSRSVRQTAGVL